MKKIIERSIPLNVTYTLTNKRYGSIIDGNGCTCDNCGKLIANIATIKNAGTSYNIGFDCLDTILENNAILSNVDIKDYRAYKASLSKVMKLIKRIKEVLKECKTLTGILFEMPSYESDYHSFYWLHNSNITSRDNDNVKIKGVSTEFVFSVISEYFKSLTVIVK